MKRRGWKGQVASKSAGIAANPSSLGCERVRNQEWCGAGGGKGLDKKREGEREHQNIKRKEVLGGNEDHGMERKATRTGIERKRETE